MLTPEQLETAKRLITDTNTIIEEYLKDNTAPAEALNRADLGAREVRFTVNDYGDCSITVLVEEAAPDCHFFCTYVRVRLQARGWGDTVFCTTEW